jgi:thiol-disulfide isomerase/thioredoxin
MLKITSSLSVAVLLVLVSLNCSAHKSSKTTISGEIRNLSGGPLQLFLEEDINRKKSRLVAEISFDQNGRFKLEKELPPHIYTLKIGDKKSVMLALETGQNISVTGDARGSDALKVSGSEDTAKLEAYEQYRKASLNRLVVSVREQIKKLQEKGASASDPQLQELSKLEVENYVKHKDELIGFIKREMGTSVAIYSTSIRWDGPNNIPFLTELAKEFEAAHTDTEVAARVKEKVKALAANSIGGTAVNIVMPDKNGVDISLASIKAKYVLIDFWASWCPPCRHESRQLGELYQRFKPQGFEIYGVGLESQKDAWLKAIDQDKRNWPNVSTFQEFETPVAFDYAVTSLPANVLIDGAGKIVARNLHGDELNQMMTKLFSTTNQ